MTTQRKSLPSTRAEKHQAVDRYSPRRFPIQHEIQELQNELNAFNERIAELEDEGHRGHAMEVLKANALDFARQIDELRCLLVESARKHAPDGRVKRPFQKLSHR
jgi:predicted  nucleic acid-binding Zn-ribbon protein